jgi:hypothetical protein
LQDTELQLLIIEPRLSFSLAYLFGEEFIMQQDKLDSSQHHLAAYGDYD